MKSEMKMPRDRDREVKFLENSRESRNPENSKLLVQMLFIQQTPKNCSCCIFFYFSPPCIFKCVRKLSAQDDAKSHWLHLFDFFHRMFLNVSPNGLPASMHIHTDCICLISLDCVFSKISTNYVGQAMQNNTCCNCFTFHCA